VILRCVECGLKSVSGRHWRAYLADDPRDDNPSEVAVFCPSCADREFGSFGQLRESMVVRGFLCISLVRPVGS